MNNQKKMNFKKVHSALIIYKKLVKILVTIVVILKIVKKNILI